MDRTRSSWWKLLIVAALLAPTAGCGILPVLLYRGRIAPAQCKELNGRRVAVICVANSGDFGPNPNASLLAAQVGKLLESNVPEIELVSHQDVEAWHDEHDVEFVDYEEVGRGVGADMVVAVELEHLQLKDNATLYKGRAEYSVRVLDIADGGKEVYSSFAPPVIYPRHSGLHTASTPKRQFHKKFIEVLAADIAQHFYEHDLNEQIAMDVPDLNGE